MGSNPVWALHLVPGVGLNFEVCQVAEIESTDPEEWVTTVYAGLHRRRSGGPWGATVYAGAFLRQEKWVECSAWH